MTPMIDVTFLLLFFFMVTSHLASKERIDVDLPHPDNNRAAEKRIEDKLIISVQHVADGAPQILLGAELIASIDLLGERLVEAGRRQPNAEVILRADRRLPYRDVRGLMEMISQAGLSRLQVVTELGAKP